MRIHIIHYSQSIDKLKQVANNTLDKKDVSHDCTEIASKS